MNENRIREVGNLTLGNLQEEIKKLKEKIARNDYFYYSRNTSIISDVEYDTLVTQYRELREEYKNITGIELEEEVGSSLKDTKFQKIEHKKPMLSLNNSYNIKDVIDFINRINKNNKEVYLVNTEALDEEKKIETNKAKIDLELKLDGLSISVIYQKGKLVKGITRGDGIYGEDVTENILEIESIPKYINEELDLEVRGEIIIPISQFKKLNEERMEQGEEIFANPRNAAAGTMRQLNSKIVKERGLDAYFYFLVDGMNYGLKTHKESIDFIEKIGIKTSNVFEQFTVELGKLESHEIKKLENRIKFWEKEKEKLDFETDGLVLKVDEIGLWEEIGYTSKAPRWAIAYKFPAKQVTTKLNNVTWQVGRTGKITPVAELEEVSLSGSKVKRASLHNYQEILRKDIKIGDIVFIEKAAEIIPQVVKPVIEDRKGNEKEIIPPERCPSCNTKLIKEEELIDLKCPNEKCPEKIRGWIEYFVSRDGMNIKGLGIKIIDRLMECGYLSDISDIYMLKNYEKELKNMEKLGEKSVDKLLENIENSKKNSMDKIVYSLGIPNVGKFLAKNLIRNFDSFQRLSESSIEELIAIDGVGEKGAKQIVEFFSNYENRRIIGKLKELGVINEQKKTEKVSEFHDDNKKNKIQGKTFLFTGKLMNLTRSDAQEKVEKLGGMLAGTVNKNLDFLVSGDKSGSKLEKALKIGTIKVLTESEFLELINGKL